MTQVLRPTVETISTDSVGLSVSPQGSSFPYGYQPTSSSLLWPEVSGSYDSLTGQISGSTDNRYSYYKTISAEASANGVIPKTVTYSGFPQKTDTWTTGALIIQFNYNATGTIISNNTPPTLKIEYSVDNGSTWGTAFEVLWDVNSGSAGGSLTWQNPSEHLSVNTIQQTGIFANSRYVNSGIQTTISGISDTTGLKIRFTVGGGYIIPQGWPTNSYNSPFYIGAGFQLVDMYLTDPSATAPTPNTDTTTKSVSATLKSGPGTAGNTDFGTEFAQILPGDIVGDFAPANIPVPRSDWYVLPGTSWVSPATSSVQNAMIVSKLLGASTLFTPWASPLVGSNWISTDDQGGPGVIKARFEKTFTLSSIAAATLSLNLLVSGTATVLLNGTVVGSQTTPNQGGPASLLSINSGFVVGTNVLVFEVSNTTELIGLDFSGTLTYNGGTLSLVSGNGTTGTPDTTITYTILKGTSTAANAGFAAASYKARTFFSLPTGFSSPTLSLSLLGDNVVTGVTLNGHSLGGQTDNGNNSNTHYYTYSDILTLTDSTSGDFVEGQNTIEFTIKNYANAVGLDFLGTVSYKVPIDTGATGATGSSGYISTPDYDTPIMAVGGTQPYTYTVVADSQTTLPASSYSIVNTNNLRINGTGVPSGLYTVHLRVTDANGLYDDQIATVNIFDNAKFSIINESIAVAPSTLPYTGSVPLIQYGGSGAVTWAIQSSNTTLPNAAISGSNLTYTLAQFGTYQVSLIATDSLGKVTSKIIKVVLTSSKAYKLVDGQIEIVYSDSDNISKGSHNFAFTLTDSRATITTKSYSLSLHSSDSPITTKSYAINKYWAKDNALTYAIPIVGSASSITLEDSPSVTLANGLSIRTDAANYAVVISGTPTAVNALANAKIPLKRGAVSIGNINRTYVTVPYDGITLGNLGDNVVQTMPFAVGEFFTLNPQKPFFNSPDNSRDITWVAQVKEGTSLPTGISLDKNTGLLYGTVIDITLPTSSIIEFVDQAGVVRGSFGIQFNFVKNDFALTDSLYIGQLGTAYSAKILSDSKDQLTSAELYFGYLPAGLTLGVTDNVITLTGTPTESGYFDFWVKATNSQGKKSYLYKRLEITFMTPLEILTTTLPNMQTSVAYSFQMQVIGGTGQYTWALTSGSLPTSVTLSTAGLISGTTSDLSYSQTLRFTVTDSAGATQYVDIPLTIVNPLAILTAARLPNGTVGRPYSMQLVSQGGSGTWPSEPWALVSGNNLPSGLSLIGATGVITGSPTTTYSGSFSIQVTRGAETVSKTFNMDVTLEVPNMHFDFTGVGIIKRGCAYQGVMKITTTGTSPFLWAAGSNFPSGLVLTPSTVDGGLTCYISGKTTEAFTNRAVDITVWDTYGASVTKQVVISSEASVTITTTSLDQGKLGVAYSNVLTATGCNQPITWTLDSGSPLLPSGLNLASNGTISGTPTVAANVNLIVKATDSIGDTTTKTLNLTVVSSALVITTSSIDPVQAGFIGQVAMAATGGVTPYTWTAQDPSGNPPVGWTVFVTANGAINNSGHGASGTYTVSVSGGSGSYTGTGTFSWATVESYITIPSSNSKDYSVVVYVSVTDTVYNQTITGSVRIPVVVSYTDTLPMSITYSQGLSGAVSSGILPAGVTLTSDGYLVYSAPNVEFSKDVKFTVTDAVGAVTSKVLRVAVTHAPITSGTLVAGPDYVNKTQTNVLGQIGLYPGDIATINPRPNQSFYVYGSMPGTVPSQLTVSVVTNYGTGAYSNLIGTVESVDAAGLVKIKLSFAAKSTEFTSLTNSPSSPQSNAVDVTLTNTATGFMSTGNFTFQTVDTGQVKLYQNGATTLPVFDNTFLFN